MSAPLDPTRHYVLKVRLKADGGRDLRTVRNVGHPRGYRTLGEAIDTARRCCKANREAEDAGRFRFLVRTGDRVPARAAYEQVKQRKIREPLPA